MDLLHGPYRPPRVAVGDRVDCLYRDCECEVTGWTDARISWPRGVRAGGTGAPSIIVTPELERAIRPLKRLMRHRFPLTIGRPSTTLAEDAV